MGNLGRVYYGEKISLESLFMYGHVMSVGDVIRWT